jgi:WD40 repeat protein
VATASDDSTAKVWDATTGQELTTLAGHSSGVHYVAWSPDGQRIVTASADETARQYDANLANLLTLAQNRITRGLTPEERAFYVGEPVP